MQAHRDLRTNALTLTGSARISRKRPARALIFFGTQPPRHKEHQDQTLFIRC